VLFAALPTLVLLFVCDLGTRFWYDRSLWRLAAGIVSQRAEERTLFRKPLARFDPVVGYACIPGVHQIALVKGQVRLDFRVIIGDDGYRITSRFPAAPGAQELWISGCSFTWGLGVNDEETFPWLVQAAMPALRVRNLGGSGYGTVQALLQLRHAEEDGLPLPKIAVVVYNDFHLERNVAAPPFLRMMNKSNAFEPARASVPTASLDSHGALQIAWLPLFQGLPDPWPDPAPDYEVRVTTAILDDIRTLCRRHGIIPVFAIQSRPSGDLVLEHARQTGYVIADLWIDLDERASTRYRLVPVDRHPNPRAHAAYARKLLAALRPTIAALH
jgi:hypothetical protein